MGDGFAADAESCGAGLVDQQLLALGIGLDRAVDIDNALGLGHACRQLAGFGAALRVIRPIYFGDQRRHDRRAGRHFNDLHRGLVALGGVLQRGAQGQRDVVALAFAVVFIDQVDLQITDQRTLTQKVLAHQAVEGDRRRSAGVGLVVKHFRHLVDLRRQFAEQGVGLLEGTAFGHIDHQLDFRFIVVRQHFQHHQLDYRQTGRQSQQQRNGQPQPVAFFRGPLAHDEPAHHTIGQRVQFGRLFTGMCFTVLGQQFQAQPRRHDQGDQQRDQHADRRVDRDRTHVRTHQAGHERHRQQSGDDGEGGQYGRRADFVDRGRNRFQQAFAAERAVPVDVFDYHDGVIDQDADGKNQCEQRHPVQGKAHGPRSEQSDGQGQYHRATDHKRFAPAECEQHQQHHRAGREDQFLDQFRGLVGGRLAVIAGDLDIHAFRNDLTAQALQPCADRLGDIGGVAAGLFRHRHGDRRRDARCRPAASGRRAVPYGLRHRLNALSDAGDIREQDRLIAGQPDHQIGDVPCAGQELAGLNRCGTRRADAVSDMPGLVACLQGLRDFVH